MLREISLDLPEDRELVAVATFTRGADGEYTMEFKNVTGIDSPLTNAQKVRLLRILATGIEAEAIAQQAP